MVNQTMLMQGLLALALSAPLAARPQQAAKDEPVPLELRTGESVAICATGTITCPARDPICDDGSVATGAVTKDGLAFSGLKPGTTLCSAASASGQGARRVYRVTVRGRD